MTTYCIMGHRSAASVGGAYSDKVKVNGVPLRYATREEAQAVRDRIAATRMSHNVSYTVKEWNMKRRITAAEVVATHVGWDMAEMSEVRYQPTRYRIAVYTIGEDYYCAPSAGKPPGDFNWQPVGETLGRMVYCAKPEAA